MKSKALATHLEDLMETFQTLREFNMRLNPSKCAFKVKSGKFLVFTIHERRIDVNPEKVWAIIKMQPPKTVKEVQWLTGQSIAIN